MTSTGAVIRLADVTKRAVLICSVALTLWPNCAVAQSENDEHPPGDGVFTPVPPPPPPLDQNCTASLQNRSIQVNPDGSFLIPNIPVDQGLYRIRVICEYPDGTVAKGQSPLFSLAPANEPLDIPSVDFNNFHPIPVSIRVAASRAVFSTRGETAQLTVTATQPDGSTKDITTRAEGTTYATSNPAIATVGENGLVTAVSRGRAILSARNESVLASVTIEVAIPNDADGDGLTDEYERANGLDPNDAADAGQDPDQDGLTNAQEFQAGTGPRLPDTDGDGLLDGAEIAQGSDPLRADTDADGLADGDEVRRGLNPVNPDGDGDGLRDGVEVQLGLDPRVVDPLTTVQGRVLDGAGVPVAKAAVSAFTSFTALTDSTGAFAIPSVPAGLGSIRVFARVVQAGVVSDGLSAATAPVAGGLTDVGAITLATNAGSVTGLVTDPLDRPVASAIVTVTASGDVRTASTDSTGRYVVTGLSSGSLFVTASDPRTGLRARAEGTLPVGSPAALNLRLGAWGSLVGTVFARDGRTPVAGGVSVSLSGASALTTTTDPTGRYRFDFIPIGSVTVDAADGAGNRGRTTRSVSATGQTVVADVTFLGRGTVAGVVRTAGSVPVANAAITLTSGSIFGGTRTTTTDGSGAYSIASVFVGPFAVSARDGVSRLAGQADGTIDQEGQNVTANVVLAASGSITGTVLSAGGTAPVAGVQVTLRPGGLATITDGAGVYRFDVVATGSYEVNATDLATGDRARGNAALSTQDQVATVNLTLNGLGRVVVTVLNAVDVPLPDAAVTLQSETVFGGTKSAVAQADGTAAFEGVLAGPFRVTVSDPASQLGGSTTGSVARGATANVTVRLQPAGTIRGTVFAGDQTTLVANALVRLIGSTPRQTTTGADGTYRFDLVPTGSYSLEAADGAGFVQARASAAVSAQGQVVVRDLTFIGTGSVSGRVTLPDGVPAVGMNVTVQGQAPGFPRTHQAQTDVDGRYSASGVPVGPFKVTSNGQAGGMTFFGETTGTIATHGQVVTADLTLAGNITPVTRTLRDVNGFSYNVRENGSLQDGTTDVFAGAGGANRGGLLLEIVRDGATERFAGSPTGTTEEGGREIVIRQNLSGLEVTRKIFVPTAGYFARYLEILTNPSGAPVTVSARLTTHLRFIFKTQGGFLFDREPRIVATSSGDTALDVSDPGTRDRWVVFDDDEDLDPFLAVNLPTVAHVFDGETAATAAASAEYALDFGARFGRATQEWRDITIPAGGSLALMHFVVEQTGRSAARASAERLLALPPEALSGLSAEERALVRNFAIPADGSSPLPALPLLTGVVNGRVLAGDGTTAVAASRVTFRSEHPLFGRTHFDLTGGAGAFEFRGAVAESGSRPVPVGPFTLAAVHPVTDASSPATTGGFAGGLTTATQDVVFSNTGVVHGTVRRANGAVVTAGTVQVTGGALTRLVSLPLDGAGGYRVTGLVAGTFSITATVNHAQGTALKGAVSVSVQAAASHLADIVLPPTGSVTGTVRRATGDVVVGVAVQLRAAGLARSATTDTGGRFTFADVPAGTVTLETFDSASNTAASVSAVVTADQNTIQDLLLASGGIVSGLVTRPGNVPAPGATVRVSSSSATFDRVTGVDGRYEVVGVTPGVVSVDVVDPTTGLRGRRSGTLSLSGQTLTLDVALLAAGTVRGTVFRAGGVTPAAGLTLVLRHGDSEFTTSTDGSGAYTFDFVPVGTFTIDALDAANGDRGRATNQIQASGEIRTVDFNLNGLGRVDVSVRNAAGQPVVGAEVAIQSLTSFGGIQQQLTGPDGIAVFPHVLAGSFHVTATEPSTGLGASASGTVGNGQTATVNIALQPIGALSGRVFAADGTTLVPGTTVRLLASGVPARQVTSATDGSFRFDAVPLGTYTLDEVSGGRVRAKVSGVVLARHGDAVVQDLVRFGLGTVRGLVRTPAGSPAASVAVALRSSNVLVGGFFNTSTNGGGFYEIAGVPVGAFTATATSAQGLGETAGEVTGDGQIVTADIQILNNSVSLPRTLFDANNYTYDVQGHAGLLRGTASVFTGDSNVANQGASLLDLVAGGVPQRFTGAGVGTTEQSGREIVIRQQGLAGLDVVRKVFVPRGAYMSRYLELLSNPSASPVTVSVQITSHIRSFPRVTRTSSGDTILAVTGPSADRWTVVDDSSDSIDGQPAVAFLFDGAGAPTRVATATLPSTSFGPLVYRWNDVTVPAGGTVGLLHFVSQQTSRNAAAASATRLAQLPPEALEGLSADELGAVQNFVLPADGTSTMPALPALTGTVNGRSLAGDQTTPAAPVSVTFTSTNVLFARPLVASAGNDGSFSFTSVLNDSGSSRVIPVEAFTLQGRYTFLNTVSPVTTSTFAPGQTVATADVAFTNTGLIRGVVRRSNGSPVSNASVLLRRGSTNVLTVGTDADGRYVAPVLAAGSYTVTASLNINGTPLTGVASTTVVAGQASVADVTFPATGTVTGIVRNGGGAPAPNVSVQLAAAGFIRSTLTNAVGQYTIADVLPGSYTVAAFEPSTGVETSAPVVVTADQTTTQDLALVGIGAVDVQVDLASGAPAAVAQVYIQEAPRGTSFRFVGQTNGAGQIRIGNVPVGAFVVRALHPSSTRVRREEPGTLPAHGASVPLTVTLPATGTLRVTVRNAADTAVVNNISVQMTDSLGNVYHAGRTDSAGLLTIGSVPVGPFTVRAFHPTLTASFAEAYADATGAMGDAGEADVTVRLPAMATLRLTVQDASSAPVAGASVLVRDSFGDWFATLGPTDAQGVFDVANMPVGAFTIQVRHMNLGLFGRATGTIAAAQNGQTVPLAVTVAPRGHATLAFPRERDLYSFTAAGGEWLRVFVAGLPVDGRPGLPNPLTQLFGPDGGFLANGSRASVISRLLTAAGTYTVVANAPSNEFGGYVLAVELDDELVDHIPFEGGTVAGHVRRADGTTPAVGIRVNLTTVNGPMANANAVSGSDGSYSIPGVPFGTFGNFDVAAVHANGSTLASASGAVGARGDVVVRDLVLPAEGTISGRVLTPAGLAVPGSGVVLSGSVPFQFVQTDASGVFSFARVPVGAPFVLDTSYPGTAVSRQVSGELTTDGQNLLQDLVLPALATVRATVQGAGGAPLAGAMLRVEATHPPYVRDVGPTDSAGMFDIDDVPEGPFSVRADLAGSFAGRRSGTVRPEDHGQVVPVLITAPLSGSLTGRVWAADGVTPIAFAQVEIFDDATGERLDTQFSDDTGLYAAGPFVPEGGTFRVRARSPFDFAVIVERTATLATEGQTLTVDLTLPLGLVRGRVFFSDGVTPVPFPNVFVTQDRPGTWPITLFGAGNDDGTYRVLGVREGAFTLTAQDPDSGLTRDAVGTVADTAVHVIVDVTLPVSGVVAGRVLDPLGAPVPGARVAVQSSSVGFSREVTADADGAFELDRIGLGDITVQACELVDDPEDGQRVRRCGVASGVLSAAGEEIAVDVVLPPMATLSGTVLYQGAPVDGAEVRLRGEEGPLGSFWIRLETGPDGRYESSEVPVGTVFVAAESSNEELQGTAEGTVTLAGPNVIDVELQFVGGGD